MNSAVPADLQVLAELAMALAGFTGLIGVIHQRNTESLTERQKLHIAILLVSAVLVIVLSFVPNWIALIPGAADQVWEWSIRILLAAHLLAWLISFQFNRLGRVEAQSFPPVERYISYVVTIVGFGATVMEIAVVAGYFKEFSAFLYQGVLIFFLTLGLANFLSLLLNPNE